MSAQQLDQILSAKDNNASHRRLSELISSNNCFTGENLPETATKYLRAFGDNRNSVQKRRWLGLALRKMIDTSPTVVNYLKKSPHEVPRLGQVILRGTEQAETKIVAGIIIRQLLIHGLAFRSCWPSDKVPNSIPLFPEDDGEQWLVSFQSFLDDFKAIQIAADTTDPFVIFPVSITASDGFRWRDYDAVVPVLLAQRETIIVILPNLKMDSFIFIDIPLEYVHDSQICKAVLHDSQGIGVGLAYEPWDIVINFNPGLRSYSINGDDHTAATLTILFAHFKDAEQCHFSIERGLKTLRDHSPIQRPPRMSSSQGYLPVGIDSYDDVQASDGDEDASQTLEVRVGVPHEPSSSRLDTGVSRTNRASRVVKKMNGVRTPAPVQPGGVTVPSPHDDTPIRRDPITKTSKKPSALPKPSRLFKRKAPSGAGTMEDDPFAVPIEDDARKSRNKRQYAKVANLDKAESSGSEYNAPKMKKRRAPRKPAKTLEKNASKPTKFKIPSKVIRKNVKAEKNDASPMKFPVLSKLLQTNLQPTPDTSSGVYRRPCLLSQSDQIVAEEDATAKMFSESTILDRLNNTQNGVESCYQVSSPVLSQQKDESSVIRQYTPSGHALAPEVHHENVSFNQEPATLTKSRSSLGAEPTPSTPRARRTKKNEHATVANKKASEDAMQTIAPLRIMSDPSSPCVDAKRKRLERQHTPSHQPIMGMYLKEKRNVEILSSNSKTLPAPPMAASTAISGHAESECVEAAKEIGEYETARSNPFHRCIETRKTNSFIRRLTEGSVEAIEVGVPSNLSVEQAAAVTYPQSIRNAVPVNSFYKRSSNEILPKFATKRIQASSKEHQNTEPQYFKPSPQITIKATLSHFSRSGDRTNMNADENENPVTCEGPISDLMRASLIHVQSSPPEREYPPSSHSSTSAEAKPDPTADNPVPTEAEEMKWEESLEPHQRPIRDQLFRVSRRVLRHVVHNESAIDDIVDTYINDGNHLINNLNNRHSEQFEPMLETIRKKKISMKLEFERIGRKLSEERRSVTT